MFFQRYKNCTVCINLYWLWIKTLSWKPSSSDSKEGQLEFSPKCIKFSTKCYTNNMYFFHCLYSYSNLKASSNHEKTRNLCRETTLTHGQNKDSSDTITSFLWGKIFFVFSAFTYKLQILKINTCLRVLHKHPKENYLQIIHLATLSFSTLPTIVTFTSLNFHSWGSCVSATDSRSNNAYHLNTLPTIKCLYQTLFYL